MSDDDFLELTKEQMQQLTREGHTYVMEPDGFVNKVTINDLYIRNGSIDVIEYYLKTLPDKKDISDEKRDRLRAFLEAFVKLKKRV